ncbi:MAG: ribonuclease P protein component [Thermomicrobiales bacterium]
MVNRDLRLRREADVRQARARGKAFAHGPLVVRVLANGTEPPRNRYAVIAGKKVGKAVQRNRCKRLAREAIRHLHPRLTPGHDLVVIVRGTVEELTGLDVALASLEQIARRAHLLNQPSAGSRQPSGDTALVDDAGEPGHATGDERRQRLTTDG